MLQGFENNQEVVRKITIHILQTAWMYNYEGDFFVQPQFLNQIAIYLVSPLTRRFPSLLLRIKGSSERKCVVHYTVLQSVVLVVHKLLRTIFICSNSQLDPLSLK